MRVPDGSFIADRQFVAATSPAAREHGAAILGLHARAKPVLLGALTIIRLKRTFRHLFPGKIQYTTGKQNVRLVARQFGRSIPRRRKLPG